MIIYFLIDNYHKILTDECCRCLPYYLKQTFFYTNIQIFFLQLFTFNGMIRHHDKVIKFIKIYYDQKYYFLRLKM